MSLSGGVHSRPATRPDVHKESQGLAARFDSHFRDPYYLETGGLAMHLVLAHSLLALIPLVTAEFISGGSFGRSTIGPYNNCSGTLTARPKDIANDTLPNIGPSDQGGWERWDLTLYQTGLFLNMRWSQGDFASNDSDPSNATFELLAKFDDGRAFNKSVTGKKLTYTDFPLLYSISIGENTLTWDESQTWFNATLNFDGVTASIGSES